MDQPCNPLGSGIHQEAVQSVNAIAIQNVCAARLLPLPALTELFGPRGILFAVSADSDSQSLPDADSKDVAAARLGEGEAYSRIIRRHQSTIARRMMRFAKDSTTLEELVHDCFVEAYLSLRSYRGDASLSHWLAKIATRVGYRHWKTQRRDRMRLSQLESDRPFPTAALPATNDSADLATYLLDQLSPRDRLAITLLHLEGRSVSEAAEMAGWSQTMLKVQAHRARKKLRALLEKQGVHDG
jgi:RNA polymerase sigma-70 factor (ECF subfamily)